VTATVLLFDGHDPGDPALENSHWIAERTLDRLGEDAAMVTHPEAVRAHLERRLADPTVRGLALFGHGDPGQLHAILRAQHRGHDELRAARDTASEAGAVYGSDGQPALDIRNITLLAGRWCHAVACTVGLDLAHRSIEAGASCFVAYESSLTPEYETGSLPAPLRSRLAVLVTTTTLALHVGIREERTLKDRVQRAIEELEEWLEGDDGAAWQETEGYMQVSGLRGLARQLKRDMVVRIACK
jgi:hypothetical protein